MPTHKDNKETHIPKFLHPLFWESDVNRIDLRKHADTIMGRIMERGTWDAMCWLRQMYNNIQIVSFLERRGKKILSAREINYWAFVSGVPQDKRNLWVEEARRQPNVWRHRYSR